MTLRTILKEGKGWWRHDSHRIGFCGIRMTASSFSSNTPLAPYTTIGLGGPAKVFAACSSLDDLRASLEYARAHRLRVQILAGGSNIIFPDRGFDGMVIRMEMAGMKFTVEQNSLKASVAAGENWDTFVQQCIERGATGIECLSGIPGSVGASPIQNVGAYGQEVSETIVCVRAMEKSSMDLVEFRNQECRFAYRQSRFKQNDDCIITEVEFRLNTGVLPGIRYPELQQKIDESNGERASSALIRSAVLSLRRAKSMVIDPRDPNTRSCGSFFVNPILSRGAFQKLQTSRAKAGYNDHIPSFAVGTGVKIPAAWLVEQAGFPRGYRAGGVGVSHNHSLALVNFDGTTSELMDLAGKIQQAVESTFGIRLELEPVVIQNALP